MFFRKKNKKLYLNYKKVAKMSGYYDMKCFEGDVKKAITSDWLRLGGNKDNNNYNRKTKFSLSNVNQIELKKTIKVTPSIDGLMDFWVSLTSDAERIFATSHNASDTNLTGAFGYIFAVNKETCEVEWRRNMESYSGIPGDYSRAAPAVYHMGGRPVIFFGSNIQSPQTWDPLGPVYRKFGAPGTVVLATGRRPRMYAVYGDTGELIWEQEVGEVATVYSDEDNFASITQSPVVYELDVHNNGNCVPVVMFGQSTTQSFIPWLVTQDAVNPFGPSLFNNPSLVRLTDTGKFHFLDALSGAPIRPPVRTLPTFYQAGDTLDASSLRPAQANLKIRYHVTTADIGGGGDLNPPTAQFAGPQNITWNLISNGANTVPTCLDGIMVTDNTGANVPLSGGAVIPANLNGITVNIDTNFVLGDVMFAAPAGMFDMTSAGVQLDGTGGLYPARICKYLSVGDTLSEPDAFNCNKYGASIWQTAPTVSCDVTGKAVEVYFCTGQLHWNVLDEQEAILAATQNPIAALSVIEDAQNTYEGAPSAPNLAAIRASYAAWNANVDAQLAVPLSTRGNESYYDSMFALNLRPGAIGDIVWRYRAIGYDTWNTGLQLEANRISNGFPIPGVSAVQQYYGITRGDDSDFGSSLVYFPRAGPSGEDVVAGCTKGGLNVSLGLTNPSAGPTTFTVLGRVLAGNPGGLGGDNFISGGDESRLIGVQVNAGETNNENTSYQTSNDPKSVNPQPKNFGPRLAWYPVTQSFPNITRFVYGQSYMSAFDVFSNSIAYESAVTPQDATITSIGGGPAIGKGVMFVNDGSGRMQVFNSRTGEHLTSFDLQSGGVTVPLLERDRIYSISGREQSNAIAFPNSNFLSTNTMYVFGLKKSCCKKVCYY